MSTSETASGDGGAPDPGERLRLGDLLVRDGVLTRDQLHDALRTQREDPDRPRLGAVVMSMGLVSEHGIARALARQLGLTTIDPGERLPQQAAIDVLPRRIAERHHVLPLDVDLKDETLVVAMSDPTDVIALDDVRAHTRLRDVRIMVATPTALGEALTRAYDAESAASKVVERLGVGVADLDVENVDDLEEAADAAAADGSQEPVIALVNALLADAVRSRASDVHVESERFGMRVRYRVDGMLRIVQTIPRGLAPAVISRLKVMSQLDIAERRRPQDGRAMIRVAGEEVDLRVSTIPTLHGEKVVLRLLRKGAERYEIESLGLDADQRDRYQSALARSQGLILMTGPTGSGKTTTLYAGLSHLVGPELNISTLEDPTEYQLDGVNQTQINRRIGFTFAGGLRTLLRQDPDVIMVGEIRDTETAELAVEASFTGHLVLSTLHTTDAPGTVTRLAELGVERFLLATSLLLIVAQRLARRLCEHCAEPVTEDVDPRLLTDLGLTLTDLDGAEIRRAVGCQMCDETGYRGRVGLYEMLSMTPRIRQLVADGGNELQLAAMARAQGMRTLRMDAIDKAFAGVTTLEEVQRVTPEDVLALGSSRGSAPQDAAEVAVRVGAVSRHRVLVVADQAASDAVVSALPDEWRATRVTDPHEAADRAGSVDPDLIVVTDRIGGVDGLELTAGIRRAAGRGVPILLIRPEPLDDASQARAVAAGVTDTLITASVTPQILQPMLVASAPDR